MPRTGNCSQLGEVRSETFQSFPVSRHDNRHLSGEGLSVGLSRGLFSGSGSQFPFASVSSSIDVAAAVGSHGRVCSPGLSRMRPLQWHLKDHWSLMLTILLYQFLCLRSVWSLLVGGSRRGGRMPVFYRLPFPLFCTQVRFLSVGLRGPIFST